MALRGNTQRTRNEAAKDTDLSTNHSSSSDDEYDWTQKNLPKRRPPVTAARERIVRDILQKEMEGTLNTSVRNVIPYSSSSSSSSATTSKRVLRSSPVTTRGK